jgi:hypothetical protein
MESFEELYFKMTEGRIILSEYLSGHLAIEFMLRKILEKKSSLLAQDVLRMSHFQVIQTVNAEGHISDIEKEYLLKINKIRNRFTHEIDFVPTLGEIKELLDEAKAIFQDQTDGISQGLHMISEISEIDKIEKWVISELFVQICYDLFDKLDLEEWA